MTLPPPDLAEPSFTAIKAADLTIEAIRERVKRRTERMPALAFRLVVASRDSGELPPNTGSRGGLPGPNYAPRDLGGRVRVADVILDEGLKSTRIDAIEATELLNRGEPTGEITWSRRFAGRSPAGLVAFTMTPEDRGPIPLRWVPTRSGLGMAVSLGLGLIPMTRTVPDVEADPLAPGPVEVLDLEIGLPFALNPMFAQAQMAGTEQMDGQEVVRVAWIANAKEIEGLQGIYWLSPRLGFAPIRSELVGRLLARSHRASNTFVALHQTRRKVASDFVRVGEVWLPRSITIDDTDPRLEDASGKPTPPLRREQAIRLEDYRVVSNPPADTFRPRFAIRAIDEKTGNFTIDPPPLPDGLVARLERAARETPHGPTVSIPADSNTPEATEPRLAAIPPAATRTASEPTNPAPIAVAPPAQDATQAVEEPPTPPAVARLGSIRKETRDQQVERIFRQDPEVIRLDEQLSKAKDKVREVRKIIRSETDPAVRKLSESVTRLEHRYAEMWESKSRIIRERLDSLDADVIQTTSDAETLKARREGKAAELRKAEAIREGKAATVARVARMVEQKIISTSEKAIAETELKVAEAEVDAKKAALEEAEVALRRATNRREEAPSRDDAARAAEAPAPSSLADLRDAVELLELQFGGKMREQEEIPKSIDERRDEQGKIHTRPPGSEGRSAYDRLEAEIQAARARLAEIKREIPEAELRLKQAKRRVAAEETRLHREAERAKGQLERATALFRAARGPFAEVEAARARYDDLMFQLDPDYKPTTPEKP